MAIILGGVGLILSIMFVVMGVPFARYLKEDRAWEASDRSRESWYRVK